MKLKILKSKKSILLLPLLPVAAFGIFLFCFNTCVSRSITRAEASREYKPGRVYEKFAPVKKDGKTPALLLFHGFGGSPYDFKPLLSELKNRGVAYHAPLMPGHGTTPRDLKDVTHTDLMKTALTKFDHLEKEYTRVAVAGFSMGGTIALDIAAQRNPEALILFAPYIDITKKWYYFGRPETWSRRLFKILPYVKKVRIGNINDPRGRKIYDSYNHLPVKLVPELEKLSDEVQNNIEEIDCDILWFHSTGDIASDYRSAQNFFDRIPSTDKRFVKYTRSNHIILYDYDSQDAIKKTISFLEERK